MSRTSPDKHPEHHIPEGSFPAKDINLSTNFSLPFSHNPDLNRLAMYSIDHVSELLAKPDYSESIIKLAYLSAMQHGVVLSPLQITEVNNQKSIVFANDFEYRTWLSALKIADRFTENDQNLDAANGQRYELIIKNLPQNFYKEDPGHISTKPEEFNDLVNSIESALLDTITQNTNNYQIGSTYAVDRFRQAALYKSPVTVCYFELAHLSHANSLSAQGNLIGGHEIGNILVKEANIVIKETMLQMDPEALVFRGPNGAVIVISEKLEFSQLCDVISDLVSGIENRFPSSQNFIERGVRGTLRLGTSTLNWEETESSSPLSRERAKTIYYQTLREAAAGAEYIKQRLSHGEITLEEATPLAVHFQEITSPQDYNEFLYRFHNFIPPEARSDSLFIVRDQIERVLATLEMAKSEHTGIFYRTPQEALAGDIYVPILLPLKAEASRMFEMLKRPERFADNVNEVRNGSAIPILNIREGNCLEQRLINEHAPFYRADGDLDHLRDAFKTHRVCGADDYYASLYNQTAANLREFQDKCNRFQNHLSIFMIKQSNSDEYSLILIGADLQELELALEISRQTIENTGRSLLFNKRDKYTGELIEINGGVTTTLACTKQKISTSAQLALCKEENEAILNLRKLIPGKNTAGDFQLSPAEVAAVKAKLKGYIDFHYQSEEQGKKAHILAHEALTAYADILNKHRNN